MTLQTTVLLSYALLSIALLKAAQAFTKKHKTKKAMPPGPPGLPIFGNAFQLGSFQWLKFSQWKEQYGTLLPEIQVVVFNFLFMIGPIFSLDLAGQPAVVVNDFETATEFLGKSPSNVSLYRI